MTGRPRSRKEPQSAPPPPQPEQLEQLEQEDPLLLELSP